MALKSVDVHHLGHVEVSKGNGKNANKKGQHCDGAVVDDVVHAAAAAVVQSHRRRITLVMPAQELEVAPYYIHCTVVVAMSLMEFCTMFTSILTICNCS